MPLVSIVGTRRVGSAVAEKIVLKNIADVMLIDVDEGRARGEALNLSNMAALLGIEKRVEGSSSYADLEGSEVVVVAAGKPRRAGMTREDLLKRKRSCCRKRISSDQRVCSKINRDSGYEPC